MFRTSFFVGLLGTSLLFSALFSGCGQVDRALNQVDEATLILDRNLDRLAAEPAHIERILKETIVELEKAGQTTVSHEVTNLTSRFTTEIGEPLRHDVDFLAARASDGLKRIRATVTGEPVSPKVPYFCKVIPNAVELRLQVDRRSKLAFIGWDLTSKDKSGKGIQLFVINADGSQTDVTSEVGITTPYEGTVNLGPGGVELSGTSKNLRFVWGKEQLDLKVNVIQRKPVPYTQEVALGAYGPYVPPHVRGDTEYNGAGPRVAVDGELRHNAEKNTLEGRVHMWATEWDAGENRAEDDYTTADGWSEWKTVFTPDAGVKILGLLSDASSRWEYVDTGHGTDVGKQPNGECVQRFECIGDTSEHADAGTHTKVTAYFNNAKVKLVKTGDAS